MSEADILERSRYVRKMQTFYSEKYKELLTENTFEQNEALIQEMKPDEIVKTLNQYYKYEISVSDKKLLMDDDFLSKYHNIDFKELHSIILE